jgi:type II secretory pathway predicted ATPase ExeA
MEHLEFFNLPADPFQNDADARFYYESAPQKRARLRLLRGIQQRKSLSVLLGGPGLGKTTLANSLLRALDPKEFAAHYLTIPHESCSSSWFLPNVARAFGVPAPSPETHILVDQIAAQLTAVVTSGRTPVLLVDEAQLFRNREAMEEFRGMLNLSDGGKRLISLVLFGLHELGEILRLDPPLAQRVEIRVEMTPMDWLEAQAYVAHRLRLAGATQAVFAPDALEALFRWSGGVPRVLNTLADNALFEGFLAERRPVDHGIVDTAAQSLGLSTPAPTDTYTYPVIPAPAAPGPDLLTPAAAPRRKIPAKAARRPLEPPAAAAVTRIEALDTPQDAPDWLEPVAPMPEPRAAQAPFAELDSVVAEETAPELDAEPLVDPTPSAELDLELEDVVAEETLPPLEAESEADAAEPELGDEPEPMLGLDADDETPFGSADSDSDEDQFSLGSLVENLGEDEPAEAEPEPEPEEPEADAIVLAPRRARPTMPYAQPSPLAAKPAPPKPDEEDSFDLRNLVNEEDSDSAGISPPTAQDEKKDDDDLDALFDQIQVGD